MEKGIPVLNMKIKVDVMEVVIEEHKPEACERNNQTDIYGERAFQEEQTAKADLKAGWCLECSRTTEKVGLMGVSRGCRLLQT